ncbi:MAG: rRNA maturation RNase YbeY [Paenibacillaceae bacterium]
MSLTLEWNSELKEEIPGNWIDKLKMILHLAGEMEGIKDGEVALSFVDDEAIRELNKNYRGLDKVTDVLSFALTENETDEPIIMFNNEDWEEAPDAELLGDIVISIPRALEQSKEYGHSLEREISFLFVHGFLHLIGYDHQDEAAEQIMIAKQEQILTQIGLTR